MKVATHIVFSECCWFAASAVFDVHYGTSAVLVVATTSVLPDADYPRSWLGHQLGSVSKDLNRLFGHRSFLHSLLALTLVTATLGLLLWWIAASPALMVAVTVGYGSHLLADMMTLGGVQLFWPSRLIAVFPGRDEYRVVSGGNSERVFVAFALALALLFYPVSRVGFDGLIYRMGGDDSLYGRVTKTTDGDTINVETQGRTTPVRLIGVDTPETVAPDQPIGCYGKEASEYTEQVLEDRLVRLEIPRVGDSEDAYGRTLAYVYLDTDKDGAYENLFNEDLITLGLARTTTFSHANRREFERLREEAEERGAGLWGSCADVAASSRVWQASLPVEKAGVAATDLTGEDMTRTRPEVGQFYSCAEQSKMHGGNPRLTLPDSEGEVTLIRFRLDKNPDGPLIIDHGPPRSSGSRTHDRVEMLRHQSGPIPVYKYLSGGPGSTSVATWFRASRKVAERPLSVVRSAVQDTFDYRAQEACPHYLHWRLPSRPHRRGKGPAPPQGHQEEPRHRPLPRVPQEDAPPDPLGARRARRCAGAVLLGAGEDNLRE